MMVPLYFALLLLATKNCVQATMSNDSYVCIDTCRCSSCGNLGFHNASAVSCRNKTVITTVRLLKNFKREVCSLDISFSGDSVLKKSFQDLRDLQLLRLCCNGFFKITQSAFVGLHQLQFLDLSYNKLKGLKINQFAALVSLTHLQLEHNKISATWPKAFGGLANLQYLNLSYNKLEHLKMDQFADLVSLTHLHLEHNHINDTRTRAFGGLTNLKYLDLSYNKLEVLKMNQFAALISLTHLHLEHNHIVDIRPRAFGGLANLQYLNLGHNNLTNLSVQVFLGLSSLRHLDLSSNRLRSFKGSPLVEMPKLVSLNITGNTNFTLKWRRPQNHSTTVSSTGTKNTRPTTKRCSCKTNKRIYATRNKTGTAVKNTVLDGCFRKTEEYMIYDGILTSTGRCSNTTCPAVKFKIRKTRISICWNLRRQLRVVELILGCVALLFNLTVLVTVYLAQSLRKSTSFCLVAHLAFCDILLGIYSLGIAYGHSFQTRDDFMEWKDKFCPVFRSIFILNQVVGVTTATLTTLERYLAIVFCMNPTVRLRRKTATIILLVSWALAVVACVSVQIFDAANASDSEMCLIYRNSSKIPGPFLSEVILLIVGLVYILTFPMYVHIYIAVKRCTREAGINRESKLAKRIALIVITSMVLFVVPNVLLAVFIVRGGGLFTYAVLNKTLLWWLPPMLLVVNSCMNPCFFAFRNELFMRQFKQNLNRCRRGVPRSRSSSKKLVRRDDISKNIGLSNLSQVNITEDLELKSLDLSTRSV